MSTDLNRRAVEIFKAVYEYPSDAKAAAIRGLTEGNTELERLVVSMLENDQAEEAKGRIAPGAGASFMEKSIASRQAEIPERIGRYRLTREIGRGGMGVVYEAEQAELMTTPSLRSPRKAWSAASLSIKGSTTKPSPFSSPSSTRSARPPASSTSRRIPLWLRWQLHTTGLAGSMKQ